MKIVSAIICPFVQRVVAILEAKEADYDVEYIDLANKPDWFLKASPHGQVPILITDDDQVLFESDTITEYIDEVCSPPLHPSDPVKKAQHRAWCELASKNYLVQCATQRSETKDILNEKKARFVTAFEKIETYIGEGPYFDGSNLSMVDIAWIPLLHRANLVKEKTGFDFLSGFPKAQKWQAELKKTRAFQRSVPEGFEEMFSSFYLNENSWLGRQT